jgi:TldD protein
MEREGLLEKDYHFLLLGYRGGQVSIKTGNFVFQCDGAVNLADPTLQVYQPGIFSGEILSVLESVKISLGQEKYNAIGTCGKAGQMVPSSGGGSGYILLEKNEKVKLGGSEIGR